MKIQIPQKRNSRILLLFAVVSCLLVFLGSISRTEVVSCTEDRVSYLAALGWNVDPNSEQSQTLRIPEQFGDVYTKYNDLQQQQGFDLTDYAGKDCTLYTYTVTNTAQNDATILADLYVRNDRIIAGDIHSTALDGFMVGIR